MPGPVVVEIAVGRRPSAVAVGEGAVWVVNTDDKTVSRINPSAGEVDGDPIAVGPSAQGIAVGGGSVWVANMGNDTVLRIDPELCQVQGEPIEVSSEPAALAYGDGGIWVAGGSFGGTLSRIDVASGAVGAAVPAGLPGSGAHGIAVGEGAVWVIDIYEKKVVRIDPGTQEPSMMRSPSMESRKRSPSAGGVRGWPRLPGNGRLRRGKPNRSPLRRAERGTNSGGWTASGYRRGRGQRVGRK